MEYTQRRRGDPQTAILARAGWESELCALILPRVPIIHDGDALIGYRIATLIRTYPPTGSSWERIALSSRVAGNAEILRLDLTRILAAMPERETADLPLFEDES